MNDLIQTVRVWVDKVDNGLWVAQEDCPNCRGNGFTVYDTEAGYERDECHCLIPENRVFNANAPEWLLQLCDQVEAQEREIERIEQERNRLILSLKSSHERTVYDLREAQAKEIERLNQVLAEETRMTERLVKTQDAAAKRYRKENAELRAEIEKLREIQRLMVLSHIKGGEG